MFSSGPAYKKLAFTRLLFMLFIPGSNAIHTGRDPNPDADRFAFIHIENILRRFEHDFIIDRNRIGVGGNI